MKTSIHKLLAYLLTVTLMITVPCGTAAAEELDEWKTPQEAVSEMTWGVNLTDLYITDVPYDDGYTVGYYDFSSGSSAEFQFAAWFWDTAFVSDEWGIHETTFSVSIPIPDYNANSADWIGGLFTLGILGEEELKDLSITLSDSKITKNGATVGDISFLDCTYPLDSNIQPNNNNNTYWLWLGGQNADDDDFSSRLPAPSPDLNGAVFETTVTLSNGTTMTDEEKADYFFQYHRTPMDPEDLTDLFLNQGANVVRLPVTWTPFIDDQTFEIDEAWLKKVQVEVDYLLSQGAYCILNMHNDYLGRSFVGVSDGDGDWADLHWENEWMYGNYKEYVEARYAAVWTQIATYFKDYPQKLILESFNEPTMEYHGDSSPLWDSSKYEYPFDEEVARVNELNQLFVDTVRSTGGNNSKRLLCVATANYNHHTMPESYRFTLPQTGGKVDENLIVQLHSYDSMEVNGNSTYDSDFDYVSGTQALIDDIGKFWDLYPDTPILIGEVGVAHNGTDEQLAPRVAHYFAETEKLDIPCLWWEDYFTGAPHVQYWLYDKKAQEWARPQILQAIKDALGITATETSVHVTVSGKKHSFTTPCSEEGTVYAAVYDKSGKLLGITTESFDGNTAVDLSLTIRNLPDTYSVKIFLLDPVSLRPLTEALQ